MAFFHRALILIASALVWGGCGKSSGEPEKVPPQWERTALGADLSLLPSYVAANAVFQDAEGNDVNVLSFLKQKGLNYVRCRLFVNPDTDSGACQDITYVTDFGKTVKNAGLELLLDFHYSDTWADPGKQTKPEAWKNIPTNELPAQVYQYTKSSLTSLKEASVTPRLIQIGNEITSGMLWEDGKVSVWENDQTPPGRWTLFLSMLAEASRACREICPDAKIIIHTDRSGDAETLRRYYLWLENANIDYDIIGLSYYPFWHGTFADVASVLTVMGHLFSQKEIMFVETAYPYNEWGYPSDSKYPSLYPTTPQGQADFTKAFVALLGSYPQVTGLFWWFAEETYSPNIRIHPDMHRGLFHNRTGKALPALDELKTFI